MSDWLDLGIPKHVKKAPKSRKKKFGIETMFPHLSDRWMPWKWYPTEERRDQAFADIERHRSHYDHCQFRKLDR